MMKKSNILMLLSILFSVNTFANKIEIFQQDGYMPLNIEDRVIFYITKEYTDNTVAPKGTIALVLINVDCKKQIYKKTIIKYYDPIKNKEIELFRNDEDIANSLRDQDPSNIDKELLPTSNKMCNFFKK